MRPGAPNTLAVEALIERDDLHNVVVAAGLRGWEQPERGKAIRRRGYDGGMVWFEDGDEGETFIERRLERFGDVGSGEHVGRIAVAMSGVWATVECKDCGRTISAATRDAARDEYLSVHWTAPEVDLTW